MMTQHNAAAETHPYQAGMNHLQDEFAYIRTLLNRHLDRDPDKPELPEADPSIALRQAIDRRLKATKRVKLELPLMMLTRTLKLTPLDRDVLLVLAAAELDPGFSDACTYVWPQFEQQGLTVGRVCDVVSRNLAQRFESMTAMFSSGLPLQRHGLVHLGSPADSVKNVQSQSVKISPLVLNKLLGSPIFHRDLSPYVSVHRGSFSGLARRTRFSERRRRSWFS